MNATRSSALALSLASAIVACAGSILASCSASPKPPPCNDTTPWTPAPIPRPASAAASVAPTPAPAAQASPYSIEQLLKVRRSTFPRAIDDQRFAFLYDAPGTYQLHASTKQGEAPKQLTSFGDRVSSHRVAPGASRAVFLKDAGGNENDQIWRIGLAGGEDDQPVALTDAPKVKHTLPVFDAPGKRIAFTSNARNGKDMDLYVVPFPGAPAKEGKTFDKPTVTLAGSHAVTDFAGDRVLVVEARSNVDQDVWIVDLKTKKKTLLTKHEGDERWEAPRFSRDGKVVFALTDSGREFTHLVAIDVKTLARTTIHAEDHDLGGLAMPRWAAAKGKDPSAVEDLLVYSVNVDGIESMVVLALDASRKQIRKIVPKLEGVIGTFDVSPSGAVAFASVESSTRPTEVYKIDLATGAVSRETTSDHAGIEEDKLVPHQLVSFPTFDGRKISSFWWAPQGASSLPVVIEIHGGPESQAQPWFSPVRQYLALSGYAVAAPNVRGSIGYGKSFAHLDDKDKREDSVRDIHELGKYLATRPDVDPKRIALYGGSYGGYMVLAGLTLYPDQWAAGVDIVGIANFRTFLEQTAAYRRALREAEYGSLEKDLALLEKISPIHKVDKITAPLMVVHGTNDPRVPIGEAKQIAEALEKRGTPVKLLVFDDEGHGLSKLKNRLVAYPAVVEFLDRHVKARK